MFEFLTTSTRLCSVRVLCRALGTIAARRPALGASTPWNRIRCRCGCGTSQALHELLRRHLDMYRAVAPTYFMAYGSQTSITRKPLSKNATYSRLRSSYGR